MSSSSIRRTCVWLFAILAAAALVLAASPAAAQPEAAKQKAKQLYQQGKTQFDLGNFEDAVKLFKEAYATSPYPELLFNIAQAYRQMGDCRQALFFYKRYITVAGNSANKPLVEEHIRELTKTCKATEDIKNKPPLGAMSPKDGDKTGTQGSRDNATENGTTTTDTRVANADDEEDVTEEVEEDDVSGAIMTTQVRQDPRMFTSAVEAGPAFLRIGDLNISGAQFSVMLSAGYPLNFGNVGVTVGGLATLTPVPWTNEGMSGTSRLTSLLANVGVRYWVLDKLALRGEAGLGGLILSGLAEGNVFLPPGDMATGALTMFNIRVGVGAEYLISNNLAVSISPLVYSTSPAKQGLRAEIDSFNRIEVLAGVGYRM